MIIFKENFIEYAMNKYKFIIYILFYMRSLLLVICLFLYSKFNKIAITIFA